jgi:hypothetical protein
VVHADGLSTVSTLGSATVRTHGHDHGHDRQDHTDRESINTVTTVQSSASLQAAPPARKSPWLLGCAAVATMLAAGIILAAIGSLPGFLLGTVATGWLFWGRVRNAHRWNQEEYPALLAKWQRTFRCDRCGAHFEADLPTTADP